jgi:hypothetical protein
MQSELVKKVRANERQEVNKETILLTFNFNTGEIEEQFFKERLENNKNAVLTIFGRDHYCRIDQPYYCNNQYCMVIDTDYLLEAKEQFKYEIKYRISDIILNQEEIKQKAEIHIVKCQKILKHLNSEQLKIKL